MDKKTASEVIGSYLRRGKGSQTRTFVDQTRNGAYLEVDVSSRHVREISAAEYARSPHVRYSDGLMPRATAFRDVESRSDDSDDSDTCPDCGRDPCKSAHGIDCP